MAEIKVSNLHECAWYIANGAEIKAIEGYPVNSKISCEIYLSSPEISDLQAKYFSGAAEANIFTFQRAYRKISTHIAEAKKKIKRQLTQESQQEEIKAAEGGER